MDGNDHDRDSPSSLGLVGINFELPTYHLLMSLALKFKRKKDKNH